MSSRPSIPVETLHHIATLSEQMSQQARRCDLSFVAYLLSMASQEARGELKKAGFPIEAGQSARAGNVVQ